MSHGIDRATELRFWAKVDKSPGHGPAGECWVWTAFIHPGGYGMFKVNGASRRSNRVAWMLANGRWPSPGKFVCHTCDVRHCVNPSHLWEGTREENMADMARKGRGRNNPRHGENHPNFKYSSDVVAQLFKLRLSGLSYRLAAERVGMSKIHAWRIVNGERRQRDLGLLAEQDALEVDA